LAWPKWRMQDLVGAARATLQAQIVLGKRLPL